MEENKNPEIKRTESKKFWIYIVVFVIVLVEAVNLLNNFKELSEVNVKTDLNNEVESNTIFDDNSEDENVEKESYVKVVTEENFEEEVLKSDKKVLIDFYADWCGPCKMLSPIVEEVAKENPDIKVVKIDVDLNNDLSYKYKAYSIPTLVVIENGEEVNRAVGAIPKESVIDLLK